MRYIEREEVAWAAGLYEGEGSVWYSQSKKSNGYQNKPCPAIKIAMTDLEPLCCFWEVFELGSVLGPYKYERRPKNKPFYVFNVSGFERVQAIIAAMWHWLSPRRREQAIKVLVYIRDFY